MSNKVGRVEKISFPELNLTDIGAKVDTGAYGVAIHVDNVELQNDILHFTISEKQYVYDKYKTITVKNSFGKEQKRFSILTRIKIGDKIYKFYVSLTNRKKMKYPVLLGRRFLYKFNYLVDVKKKNINDTTKKM